MAYSMASAVVSVTTVSTLRSMRLTMSFRGMKRRAPCDSYIILVL